MDPNTFKVVCLVGQDDLFHDDFKGWIKSLGYEVKTFPESTTALESCGDETQTLFLTHDFTGNDFQLLNEKKLRLLGTPAARYYFINRKPLRMPSLHGKIIHNFVMKDLLLTVTGVTKEHKKEADKYLNLIRYMGGRSRADLTVKINFLVSFTKQASGDKYRHAVLLGIPVVSIDWIDFAWENRFDENFTANKSEVLEKFRVKPFEGLRLAFVNFSGKDRLEMIEQTVANGGLNVDPLDEKCTHIVVDSIQGEMPHVKFNFRIIPKLSHVCVVHKEWFWSSIEQEGRADETFEQFVFELPGLIFKNSKDQKKTSTARMSVDCMLSPNLDVSSSSFASSSMNVSVQEIRAAPPKKITKRYRVCMELLDTERNYLNYLLAIQKVFYEPLSKCDHLDSQELKTIFGHFPPLLEVHSAICQNLEKLIDHDWKETNEIGKVFLPHGEKMLKAYPPYINFYENTKKTLEECCEKSKKFSAFLKMSECKPECRRQPLVELLIQPVQRLPRYPMLLGQILKETEESSPDHKQLKAAMEMITNVLSHLNEDKRKTECQVAMFEVVNDIEGGTALLSSRRLFLDKIDAKLILKEADELVCHKGHTLTLFLFTDILVICKKRTVRRSDSLTSRNSVKGSSASQNKAMKKPYKQVVMIPLNEVVSIFDFCDEVENGLEGCIVFTREHIERNGLRHDDYPLQLGPNREGFINKLLTQHWTARNNAEVNRACAASHLKTFNFDESERLASSLSKSRFGTAKAKITRTFSMSRRQSTASLGTSLTASGPSVQTLNHNNNHIPQNLPRPPSSVPKNRFSRLSQLVSPVFSPMSRKQSISTLCLNNLSEMEEERSDDTFSLPSTPAPRKKKCSDKPSYSSFLTPN